METTNETPECSTDLKFISDEEFNQKNISFQIAQWVALVGISSALAALLIILRRVGLELHKDPRTGVGNLRP